MDHKQATWHSGSWGKWAPAKRGTRTWLSFHFACNDGNWNILYPQLEQEPKTCPKTMSSTANDQLIKKNFTFSPIYQILSCTVVCLFISFYTWYVKEFKTFLEVLDHCAFALIHSKRRICYLEPIQMEFQLVSDIKAECAKKKSLWWRFVELHRLCSK